MNNSKKMGTQTVILDCNVWVTEFFKKKSGLVDKFTHNHYQVILTSYMVVEILRVFKRLSTRLSIPYIELEKRFWEVCSFDYIKTIFTEPLSESLISEVRHKTELKIIAKVLNLEVKDVPYLVAAYEHHAILISNDLRSLVNKRKLIEKILPIEIQTLAEFLDQY